MDSLTHACFGYALTRITGVATTPRHGMVAGFIALVPDLDVVVALMLDDVTRLAFHRGPSHSLVLALLAGMLCAPLVRRSTASTWSHAFLLGTVAWISHLLCDAVTGYGTAWWWPFSQQRVSFEWAFVVDPLVTLPLLAAVVYDFCADWRGWRRGRMVAAGALSVVLAYFSIGIWMRAHVVGEFTTLLEEQHDVEVLAVHAEPTPFNNQLWYLCASTEKRFYSTYRSIWDGRHGDVILNLPRRQQPLLQYRGDPVADKLLALFKGWFTCLHLPASQELQVVDLRLGRRYGWEADDPPFAFLYLLRNRDDGPLRWELQRPAVDWDFGRLAVLWRRVWGWIPAERKKEWQP